MPATKKKPVQRYTVRKPTPGKASATRARAQNSKNTRKKPVSKVYSGLPSWGDISAGNERKNSGKRGSKSNRLSTVRFGVIVLLAVVLFTLYVGHVYATQEALAFVQEERRENLRLHLRYNRVKGEFDRMTGPEVIYQRAKELGLEEGFAYGPAIRPVILDPK